MGTDNLYWKNKLKKADLKRKAENRGRGKELFLIVCEGRKTEPNYFKAFKVTSARIVIQGLGYNTMSLVKAAIGLRDEAVLEGIKYDQAWCVFDKDDFPIRNVKSAITLADKNNIHVAYSNEAFELWYILHFCYLDAAISRNDYKDRLDDFLGEKYKKNDKDMYEKLLNKGNQADAINNANKLLASYPEYDPARNKPLTTVHNLVIQLNKYI